jgi:hypothetical protein
VSIEEMTATMLEKAIEAHTAEAYRNAPVPLTVRNRIACICEQESGSLTERLSLDVVEKQLANPDGDVLAYSLRLGNEKYPHMKLTIARESDDGYVFAVDTHDRHFELADVSPDAPRARGLQAFNAQVSSAIVLRWSEAELPTLDEE